MVLTSLQSTSTKTLEQSLRFVCTGMNFTTVTLRIIDRIVWASQIQITDLVWYLKVSIKTRNGKMKSVQTFRWLRWALWNVISVCRHQYQNLSPWTLCGPKLNWCYERYIWVFKFAIHLRGHNMITLWLHLLNYLIWGYLLHIWVSSPDGGVIKLQPLHDDRTSDLTLISAYEKPM